VFFNTTHVEKMNSTTDSTTDSTTNQASKGTKEKNFEFTNEMSFAEKAPRFFIRPVGFFNLSLF